MKITNKTVGWGIVILFGAFIILGPFVEWIMHGCDLWDENKCDWSQARIISLCLCLSVIMFNIFTYLLKLIDGDIEFEYEIGIPKSKRRTLNKLYSKMGEAAMKGDGEEEKRIWEVIQRIESNNE